MGGREIPWPYDRELFEVEGARVVDPESGGEKFAKTCRLGAVDPLALEVLGQVAGQAIESGKYDRYNYLKGYDWSLSQDALLRHNLKWWGGQDLDRETGLPHIAHVAWHALAQLSFYLRNVGTDDRPPKGTSCD